MLLRTFITYLLSPYIFLALFNEDLIRYSNGEYICYSSCGVFSTPGVAAVLSPTATSQPTNIVHLRSRLASLLFCTQSLLFSWRIYLSFSHFLSLSLPLTFAPAFLTHRKTFVTRKKKRGLRASVTRSFILFFLFTRHEYFYLRFSRCDAQWTKSHHTRTRGFSFIYRNYEYGDVSSVHI